LLEYKVELHQESLLQQFHPCRVRQGAEAPLSKVESKVKGVPHLTQIRYLTPLESVVIREY